ncbi:MAG: oligosaccharide flippase family protein, partial [Promethearchaeota archaeon]
MTIKENLEINSKNSSYISQRLAKESIHSVSWLLVFRISGIISSIIIANILLEQYYGIYSVLSSWGLVLNYFCSMGIPVAAAKIISENRITNPEKNYTLFGNMILINSINFILVLVFSFLTLNFFTTGVYNIQFYEIQLFETLLLLTVLKASIYSFFSLEQGIATGFREFKAIALILITCYFIKIPILYILVINYNIIGVFLAEILTELLVFLGFFFFLSKYFRKKNIKFTFKIQNEQLKKIYYLGIPSFLSNLIFISVNWFGLTILATNLSFIDVGYFQTSLNIVNLVFLIPYGIIAPLLPDITEKYQKNTIDFYETISKILKLIVLIIFPLIIFIGLFCPFLIKIFYAKYDNLLTFYSTYILLPYIFINGFTMVFFYAFISMEKGRILIVLEACKGISFFILTILLVPSQGIMGLAYVYFLSFLIYSIIYQVISIRNNFKFSPLPLIILGTLYGGFLFYSLIFSNINISSIIWIISALTLCAISSIASFILLWRDQD